MLFTINYKSLLKQQADEIKCPCNQLGSLWGFIKNNKDKRYNIIVDGDMGENEKILEQINTIQASNYNYTLECGSLQTLLTMLDKGYPAYLKFPVSDWESFYNLKKAGVTDIYIDGPICFDINSLSKISDVKIRTSPTISPSNMFLHPAANSFFIRPEDLPLYRFAIDVIDFHVTDQDIEDTLFKIYKRGTFDNYLDGLITNLPYHILNPIIEDEFANTRLNCKQICKIPGKSCHYCDNYLTFIKNTSDYFQSADTT